MCCFHCKFLILFVYTLFLRLLIRTTELYLVTYYVNAKVKYKSALQFIMLVTESAETCSFIRQHFC
jgi:hypothetical protein